MYQRFLDTAIKRLKPKLLQDSFGLEECINELCAALILEFFQQKQAFTPEQAVSLESLNTMFSVLPKYHRMMRFFIAVLEQQGLVQVDGDQVKPADALFTFNSSDFYLDKVRIMYPKFSFFLTFVSQCAKRYHEVLAGKIPGTSLLFPSGDTEKLERLYKNTPKLGYEEAMLHTAKLVIQEWSKSTDHFSVMEVGGGQGILTAVLNPLVGNGISQYCFSDIAKMFVDRAKQRLSKPEYRFATLDCSQAIDPSEIAPESYDLVVGFNVIHATPDIAVTLANLSQVVKPGGHLLFVENIKQEIWIDMLYGMVDGWWTFNDEYRSTSPLLSLAQWHDLLSQQNYSSFDILPGLELQDQYETGLVIVKK